MAHESRHEASAEPRKWGIVSGTFLAFVTFFLPQFILIPVVGLIEAIPTDTNTKLFLLQGLSELCTVGLLWLLLRYVYKTSLTTLGLGRFDAGLLGWSILAFPLYLIASTFVTNLSGTLFPSINLTQTQDIGYANPNGLVLVLVFLALVCLAPFVEELLFRGFLFTAFRRVFGFWIGAIAVSLLFAIAHGQLNVGIDVFVLSMFLCYLREKTQSLWPSIAMHALKNLVAFTYLFIIHIK